MRISVRHLASFLVAICVAMLAPALARAETVSFLSSRGDVPAGQVFGPSTSYPDPVVVEGIAGTVRGVSVTVLDLNADEDLDMALVGPDGGRVMLMSDDCAAVNAMHVSWTFEDDAPAGVPVGDCTTGIDRHAHLKPSESDPDSDDFGPAGPAGPFGTSLAGFEGISPDGEWQLYMTDDDEVGVGFEMIAYALNLEVEPQPPTPPTVVQVPVPFPVPTPATDPAPPSPVPASSPTRTGKRAAALGKCKGKRHRTARRRCRARANKLPA